MNSHNADEMITGVAQAYDTIAEHFSETRSNQWAIVEHLLDTHVKKGDRLLDVGCGNGRVSELCNTRGIHYTGVDISAGLIAQARTRTPQGDFSVANMLSLPFPDASYDHIILVASFHHIPSKDKRIAALQELSRVLKPGGIIMMTNWNLYQPRYAKLHVHTLMKRLRGEDLDCGDVSVPWKSQNAETQAQRYYHSFTRNELRRLANMVGLTYTKQYYELHGKRSGILHGQNLVTILQRP